MTGSAINSDSVYILPGMPLTEMESGGRVTIATEECFAIATDSAIPGQVVQYADEGTVTRADWTSIAGTSQLVPGQSYYLAPRGTLATTGSQRIGTARSKTVLRISISAPVQKTSTLYPVLSAPSPSLGSLGDFAFNSRTLAFYGPKTEYGWGEPAYMVRSNGPFPLSYNPITSS